MSLIASLSDKWRTKPFSQIASVFNFHDSVPIVTSENSKQSQKAHAEILEICIFADAGPTSTLCNKTIE